MKKKTNSRWSYLREIRCVVEPIRWYIIGFILFSLSLVPLDIVLPYINQIFIDKVLIDQQWKMLWVVILSYSIFILMKIGLNAGKQYYQGVVRNRLQFDIRVRIWRKLMRIPSDKLSGYSSGDLQMRLSEDINTVWDLVQNQIVGYILNMLTVVIFTGLILFVNIQLALFTLVFLLLSFLFSVLTSHGLKRINEQRRDLNGVTSSWLQKTLLSWKEIKSMTMEEEKAGEYKSFRKKIIAYDNQMILRLTLFRIAALFKNDLVMFLGIYLMGGIYITRGEMTAGSVLLFVSYVNSLYISFENIITNNINFKSNLYMFHQVLEFLHMEDMRGGIKKKKLTGEIELNQITYRYPQSSSDILHNLTLNIRAGEKIAIVGRSGEGKTTLIKCIINLLQCQKGEILFDGLPVSSYNLENFYQNVAVIMQDSVVYNISIEENLRMANPKATREDMLDACRTAQIDTFIQELPDRFDTLIGENGIKLSGGQRQRLAFARFLLKQAGVVIFDEASSALDYKTECNIYDQIINKYQDSTMIWITHRASTLSLANRIIVLHNGEICGDGTLEELLHGNVHFQTLYQDQFQELEETVRG